MCKRCHGWFFANARGYNFRVCAGECGAFRPAGSPFFQICQYCFLFFVFFLFFILFCFISFSHCFLFIAFWLAELQVRELVNDFYGSRYASCLSHLTRLRPMLELDLHAHVHLNTLYDAVRPCL